jgi:LysR family transcriptional regulator (chromosome initiation inhibitor)
VVEQQSFERAATVLSITRGAVSQRIRALEESLAQILLVRDRPVVPSPSGEVLLRHVTALRILEGSVLQELTPTPRQQSPIPLAIAVNADSLATWFPEVLNDLLLTRMVALEVVADDQDHTLARLWRGEVIGCITTEAKPAVGFLAESLGAMEYRCYATPAFQQQHFPAGFNAQAVTKTPAILFNRKDALHADFLKKRFGFSIDRFPRHYLPSPVALLNGIALGAGYGLVPSSQAAPLLAEGQLVDVCPDTNMMVELFWHHWELEPVLAQDITKLIVSVARSHLVAASEPLVTGTELSEQPN